MGQVRVDQLQQEYDVVVEWRAYLLAPDTPPEGRPYPFPPEVREQRSAGVRQMAAGVGLPLGDRDWVSNSRAALEAAEFARDQGLFDPFHRAVFTAYHAEGRDIGNHEVLQEIATSVGLDAGAMTAALREGRYTSRVEEDLDMSRQIGLTGVPAFIIGNRAIVGAQPYNVFEYVMELLGREKLAG
ncbi:MAG TPA: DsbA family oxidoreductase [Thermomicrobiales bacterium]|nr:DsbA family oxidoreductase [Thermomicrobiales bacterium]